MTGVRACRLISTYMTGLRACPARGDGLRDIRFRRTMCGDVNPGRFERGVNMLGTYSLEHNVSFL